jgi:hypothetical protein
LGGGEDLLLVGELVDQFLCGVGGCPHAFYCREGVRQSLLLWTTLTNTCLGYQSAGPVQVRRNADILHARLLTAGSVRIASMTTSDPLRARVFGSFAEAYDRWRPGYPPDAIDWLVPPDATRIADVGAGTGKLTGSLLGRGLEVVAVEPDAGMLAVLQRRHPAAKATLAPAEDLPLDDASVDAVLVGQAWHWFDQEKALRMRGESPSPGVGSA